MILVRSSVVTTEKPVATKLAARMAASAIPSTGPRAISRARAGRRSRRDVAVDAFASPAWISSSRPITLIASS